MPLTAVVHYEDRGIQVRLRTADNRIIEGAALIGADGLRSAIRQQMLAESEPRMIGYVAHRTIVPMADVTFDVDREELSAAQRHAVQHRHRLQDAERKAE
jgi:2-polyprenyl-6-methoxyphenol hydroxylase-like FAD-dependent oxidoreductase